MTMRGLVQPDPFILAFVLFVVFVVLAALVAGFALVFIAIGRRDRREGFAWAATATQLGLELAPFEENMRSNFDQMRSALGGRVSQETPVTAQRMFGMRSNRRVEVFLRLAYPHKAPLNGSKRIQTEDVYTCCRSPFINSLDLNFSLNRKTLVSNLTGAVFGKQRLQIGIPAFDELFDVAGKDPEKIKQLLSSHLSDGTTIAERFVAATGCGWNILASDSEVRVEVYGKVIDADRLDLGLNVVQELAGCIEAAAFDLGRQALNSMKFTKVH